MTLKGVAEPILIFFFFLSFLLSFFPKVMEEEKSIPDVISDFYTLQKWCIKVIIVLISIVFSP